MILITIIIFFIVFYIIDNLATLLYCRLQKKRDDIYGDQTSDKPQYTLKDIQQYKFPKKQVKLIFRIYKGWIRYKLMRLGRVPCHAYR